MCKGMAFFGGVSVLVAGLLFQSCDNATDPKPEGPVVTNEKGKLQGQWIAEDPIADKWDYTFRGNTVTIKKIAGADTTLVHTGLFTLDSSAIPTKLDIQLTSPDFSSFTGQAIKTLYEYRGAMGSFILCVILKNNPGAERPADMSDPTGENALQCYFTFGTNN